MKIKYTEEQIKRAVEVLQNNYKLLNFGATHNTKGKYWLVYIDVLHNKQNKQLQYTFYDKENTDLFMSLLQEVYNNGNKTNKRKV